jgi:hypothetical protein
VDPLIKSQLLYQLSYRDNSYNWTAKLWKNGQIRTNFPELYQNRTGRVSKPGRCCGRWKLAGCESIGSAFGQGIAPSLETDCHVEQLLEGHFPQFKAPQELHYN